MNQPKNHPMNHAMKASRALAFLATLSGLASLPALSGACVGSDLDFYAEVIQACDYRTAKTEIFAEDETLTSLTPECKEMLEIYLPYDESWDGAPAGLKDKVTEAFQVLLAYPLELPPENRVLGEMPWAMPTKPLCMIAPELYEDCPSPHEKTDHPNMARNVFNYVMSRIATITYEPPMEGEGKSASLTPDLIRSHGEGYLLSITDNFWSGSSDFFMTPFRRASILVHESWHGDSRTHTLCSHEDAGTGFNCDADMTGPYGVETIYGLSLLHGSGLLEREAAPDEPEDGEDDDGLGGIIPDLPGGNKDDEPKEKEYLLSNLDVALLAYDICLNLKKVENLRPLVEDTESCLGVGAKWLLDREGIER